MAKKQNRPAETIVPKSWTTADYLAGTTPPYYLLAVDRLTLEALASGRVLARIQVRARELLDDETAGYSPIRSNATTRSG
jgi:hypothetical protein